MQIGIPKETAAGEKRVATVPDVVEKLVKLGFQVAVESGAGDAANFADDTYRAAGASVVPTAADIWAKSDIVFKARVPTPDEVAMLREGGTLIGFVWPAQNPELMQQLAARKATVLAIDCLPRQLSRAQKMDALTSMAGISGYRAVIEAANAFGRFFNGQITAAGKVPPAKVFIAGAGVAGLAAIGTAANLGAIVRANDTRAEVADQVVSLGGEFVKVDYEEEGSGGGGYAKVMSEGFQAAQRAMYAQQAKEVDIIITTALIPGKPAPKLITAEMVRSMKAGSVIVDMAAEQGGNCELTEPGQAVVKHGVTIVGYTDLVSRLAKQSSTLYSNNLLRLTEELCKTKDGVINVNMEDDAIRGLTVVKDGNVTWPPPALKPAAALTRTRRVGVMATRGTLESAKFAALLDSLCGLTTFILQPCDGLADAIERQDTQKIIALCDHYTLGIGQFGSKKGQVDTLVLGCTHYPFAADLLQTRVGPSVRLVDTGEPVARHTRQLLLTRQVPLRGATALPVTKGSATGHLTLVSSGPPEALREAVRRWLDLDLPVRQSD